MNASQQDLNQQESNLNLSTQFSASQRDEEIHLWDYWRIIRIRLPLCISVFVLVVGAALFYCLRHPSVYRGTCQILVEPTMTQVTDIQGAYQQMDLSQSVAQQNFMETQKELILSERILGNVYKQFAEANDQFSAEFKDLQAPLRAFRNYVTVTPQRSTYLLQVSFDWTDPEVAAKVANAISHEYVADYKARMSGFSDKSQDTLQKTQESLKEAQEKTAKALNEFRVEKGIIDLEDDRKLLVDRMMRLNEALIQARVEDITSQAAVDSIETELKAEVKAACLEIFENADSDKRAQLKKSVMALHEGEEADLKKAFEEKGWEVSKPRQFLVVALEQASLDAFLSWFGKPASKELESEALQELEAFISGAADNGTIASFKLEKLRSDAKKLELLQTYSEEHSAVMTREEISAAMDAAIDRELQKAIKTVVMDRERSQLRLEMLENKMEELETRTTSLYEIANEYYLRKLAHEQARESYQKVSSRIAEIKITKTTGDLEAGKRLDIVNPATPPKTRIEPKTTRTVALAGIFGIVLGVGLCFFHDYLDTTLKDRQDVETNIQVPVLGHMPPLEGSEAALCAAKTHAHDSFSEAFRSIRTSLGLSLTGRTKQMFMFTSSSPGDGKTLASLGTALTFAREGKRVLLCEFDMRRPRLSKIIEEQDSSIKNKEDGLSKVLIGAEALSNVVWQHPNVPTLSVALCGARPPNPAELLLSDACDQFLEKAKQNYDLIVIDCPPVLHVADASIMASKEDMAVVFMTKLFKTDRMAAKSAIEQLEKVQGSIAGCILNNSEAPKKYRYYGYHYYRYGYKYSDKYTEESAEENVDS